MNRSIEYVLSKLHASLDVFPTLMGTCGGLYVVEALEPLSYPHYLAKLSFGQWAQRVSVALGNIHILRNHLSHCLYRILDSKKTSHFQFRVPVLREIHRNLKQQKNFNSRDGFFRKPPFCTFSCINPGFGGPWGML